MIDLHMHTTYSDGTDNLEMLLKNAENKKLEIISITDHDSVDAYYELEKNSELRKLYSGEIIVGTELKTFYGNVPIEILAYGIDYKKCLHDYFVLTGKTPFLPRWTLGNWWSRFYRF